MAEPAPGVIDAAGQVFVLAFDLADSEIPELPEQLAAAITSTRVQESIKKTLLDFAKTKSKTGATVVTNDEAAKLATSMGDGVKDAALKELEELIKKTPEFKKLEASIKAFKEAAQSSTLGVWVDRNKKILYVVGASLALGAAGVLYITRTGGTVVKTAMDPLKGKEFEVLQVGILTLKAGLWDFKPDARIFGARVMTTLKWEKVTVDLKLGLLAEGTQIKEVEGQAILKSGGFGVTMRGSGKPEVQQVNLGITFDYSGRTGVGTFKVGAGVMYDSDKGGSAALNAALKSGKTSVGVTGTAGPGQSGGVALGGMINLSIDL